MLGFRVSALIFSKVRATKFKKNVKFPTIECILGSTTQFFHQVQVVRGFFPKGSLHLVIKGKFYWIQMQRNRLGMLNPNIKFYKKRGIHALHVCIATE